MLTIVNHGLMHGRMFAHLDHLHSKEPIMAEREITYPNDTPVGEYSPLQVMKSAAGYYVGTFFMDVLVEGGKPFLVPGSRDSGYFLTFEEAEAYLEYFKD